MKIFFILLNIVINMIAAFLGVCYTFAKGTRSMLYPESKENIDFYLKMYGMTLILFIILFIVEIIILKKKNSLSLSFFVCSIIAFILQIAITVF